MQFRIRIDWRAIIKYDKIKKREINSGFKKIKNRIILGLKTIKDSGITLRRRNRRGRSRIK